MSLLTEALAFFVLCSNSSTTVGVIGGFSFLFFCFLI
jgi:hypothetical protein